MSPSSTTSTRLSTSPPAAPRSHAMSVPLPAPRHPAATSPWPSFRDLNAPHPSSKISPCHLPPYVLAAPQVFPRRSHAPALIPRRTPPARHSGCVRNVRPRTARTAVPRGRPCLSTSHVPSLHAHVLSPMPLRAAHAHVGSPQEPILFHILIFNLSPSLWLTNRQKKKKIFFWDPSSDSSQQIVASNTLAACKARSASLLW